MLEIFDNIIAGKVKLFDKKAKAVALSSDGSMTAVELLDIENPRRRIRELVRGVWLYFRYEVVIDKTIELRVDLAKMGDKHIEEFRCFIPIDNAPRFTLDELRVPESGYSRAKASGEILILEDIKKSSMEPAASRNFVKTSAEPVDFRGSLICYPISHGNIDDTPYVLSILASEPLTFRDIHKERYDLVLRKFATRLCLEHSLLSVRENL